MKKENSVGFYMNWHIDDAQIVKRKIGLDGQIKISDKHYLHYNKNKPKYTIIIYGSDYNIDFKGGLLEFADGSIIEPKKNYYILFNSDELHRVHKNTKGAIPFFKRLGFVKIENAVPANIFEYIKEKL